jgi:hypothetical protein
MGSVIITVIGIPGTAHTTAISVNSKHNNYSLCEAVVLCVLELFTDPDRPQHEFSVKNVHADGKLFI